MILLESVSKYFLKEERYELVLDEADAVLPTDKRVAILGGRGTGKTTLLNLICGRAKPSSGKVLADAEVSTPVGFIKAFSPRLTVAENLIHAARVHRADPSQIIDFVETILQIRGKLLQKKTGYVDRAMILEIGIALSFALPCDVYLFDEVVARGSAEFRQKCMWMFEARMATSGAVIATSNWRLAKEFCEFGLVLDQGRLTEIAGIDDALDAFASAQSFI